MNELWIARDFLGALWLYNRKPELIDACTYGINDKDYQNRLIRLDDNSYPEVTFETGPMRVSLQLEGAA